MRLLLGITTVDDLSDELQTLSAVKGRHRHCRVSSQVFISLPLIGHGTTAFMLSLPLIGHGTTASVLSLPLIGHGLSLIHI